MTLPHHHEEELEGPIIETMPEDSTLQSVADTLKQLADPSRLKIFWLLCHTHQCVANIAAAVNMSSPAVSHHLRLLKAQGLIESERHGKEMFYKATDSVLAQSLHHTIENIASISCPEL